MLKPTSASSRPAGFVMPAIELLEPRRLFSSASVSGTGVLRVLATDADDVITVAPNTADSAKIDVVINGTTRTLPSSGVNLIRIRAYHGNDIVEVSEEIDLPVVVYGNRGDDEITTGSGSDTVLGGRGDDVIGTGDGDDVVLAFKGDDDIDGGAGRDNLVGGEGDDVFQLSDDAAELGDLGEDDGIRISLGDAPPALAAKVIELLDGEEIENLLRESDDGEEVYELEWESDGVANSAKILPDGTVVELEHEVDPATLPAAVVSAVQAAHPDGEINEAESLTLPGQPPLFEVEIIEFGRFREIVITQTGEIQSDEDDGPVEE